MSPVDILKQAALMIRFNRDPAFYDADREELAAALEAMAEQKPMARMVMEDDYWSRGHFYKGTRKKLKLMPDSHDLPCGAELYAAPIATPGQEPDGYIHPDNVRRLQTGETVAFRKKPYAHDGGGIPVFVGSPIAKPEHDAKVKDAALEEACKILLTMSISLRNEIQSREDKKVTAYEAGKLNGLLIAEDRISKLKSTGADHAK